MVQTSTKSRFKAKVLRPAKVAGAEAWAFVVLPKNVSETLPRRGRTTVAASLNGHGFQVTLEPDGQLSHWLRLEQAVLDAAGVETGEVVTLELSAVEQEPEPAVPVDLELALASAPKALAVWRDTTTLARLDWIHWVTSAKQAKTRAQRIAAACDMLAGGERRVCCFDTSGFYSKAFRAPEAAD